MFAQSLALGGNSPVHRRNSHFMAVQSTSRTRTDRASIVGRSTKPTDAAPVSMPRRVGRILAWTGKAFFADNITRLGAALAFYTTVAVAPLLVLAVAVAG